METKHTPGPWKAETWEYRDPKTGVIDRLVPVVVGVERGFRIAEIDSNNGKENPYTIPMPEARANARLIAAAPAMLKALETIIKFAKEADKLYGDEYDESIWPEGVLEQGRAAIQAALGE